MVLMASCISNLLKVNVYKNRQVGFICCVTVEISNWLLFDTGDRFSFSVGLLECSLISRQKYLYSTDFNHGSMGRVHILLTNLPTY